jgi:hypothetical protein
MKSCRKAWYWLYWLLKSSLYDLAAGQRGRQRLGLGGNLRWVSADLVLQIGKVCIDLLERSNLALNHVDLSSSSRTVSVLRFSARGRTLFWFWLPGGQNRIVWKTKSSDFVQMGHYINAHRVFIYHKYIDRQR